MRHAAPLRTTIGRGLLAAGIMLLLASAPAPAADSKNLAPGFESLPKNAKIVVMPTDIELFLVSAGGVPEPKADWTDAANGYFKAALLAKKSALGLNSVELTEKDADDLAEINTLHAAIARSIQVHHFGPGILNLPTKEGKLDWSLGEPVRVIREKTGADYALFSWIRDSYASAERIVATIALAFVGIGLHPGGMQQGYASLVDLQTGRVVWFNRLLRGSGDLREPEKAAETLNALLNNFPQSK
ncbi:MAG: hypothetical protein JWO70_2363 [Betaproteobacteria bacterium]|jgi:hypothetical protein|nr:hypothetical protein [Betaproteobacteria bacterium]